MVPKTEPDTTPSVLSLSHMRKSMGVFFNTLSSGDRFILSALLFVFALTSLYALYTLQQQFLVEVPTRGGSITEGVLGSPRFVNPLLALSDADKDLVALTHAGLMGYDEKGNLIPMLAESYTVSDDETVYTFVLNENARFSDGTPVTAQDVIFTIEKVQDPLLKSPKRASWAQISASVVNARTVSLTLPRPYAPFLHEATLGILPSHLFKDLTNEEFPFSTLMIDPVGAGPFKVENIVRDRNGIVREYHLSASPHFVLGRPYISRMSFMFYPQRELLEKAAREGKIDSAYQTTEITGENQTITLPYTRVFGVFFNQNENTSLAQREVRQVLSYLAPRQAIVDEVLLGHGTPLFGPLPPGAPITYASSETLFAPENGDSVEYVHKLLSSASFEKNEETGLFTKEDSDETLSITLKTSNVPELQEVALRVADGWRASGIPTAVEVFEPSDLVQSVIRTRSYEALLFGLVIGQGDDVYAFWHSGERNDPGLNVSLYTNSLVDDLLVEARESQEEDQKYTTLTELESVIASDFPAAFLYAPAFVYTVPEELRGISVTRISEPRDRFKGVHAWHLRTEAVWPGFVRDTYTMSIL